MSPTATPPDAALALLLGHNIRTLPVVDADGYLWTGLYLGGKVARFSPDGELVAVVEIPARDVTKMAFGGPDLSTVYVTTATKNMSKEDMARLPQSGSLFAFNAPVKGVAPARVRLT